MKKNKLGVTLSYLLRHNPEDLIMDKYGWVLLKDIINKLDVTLEDIEYIVVTNNKKRFGFNEDKTKIKAYQGHSKKLGLEITFKEVQFPKFYYHGTQKNVVSSIQKTGINSKTRAYVHLSKDIETASDVGLRRGKDLVIFEIDANQMKRDGYKIYESENEVILIDHVPAKYLKLLKNGKNREN